MTRVLLVFVIACGHDVGHRPDAASGGDDDAQVVHVDAAPDPDASVDAPADTKPGHAATDIGTCTYVDQPGWLSCPTGMSCQCYYHYYKLFDHQAAHLDTWVSTTEVDITGGMIPANDTVFGITPAMIPIANPNSVYPYQLVVGPPLTIRIYASSGYIAPKFVLQTDSDCGNEGKLLDCTFTAP